MDVEGSLIIPELYVFVLIGIMTFIVLVLILFIMVTLAVMGYVLVKKKAEMTTPSKTVQVLPTTKSESCC